MLAIANCVDLRQTKMNRKELKIDRTMEYGQSWLVLPCTASPMEGPGCSASAFSASRVSSPGVSSRLPSIMAMLFGM